MFMLLPLAKFHGLFFVKYFYAQLSISPILTILKILMQQAFTFEGLLLLIELLSL